MLFFCIMTEYAEDIVKKTNRVKLLPLKWDENKNVHDMGALRCLHRVIRSEFVLIKAFIFFALYPSVAYFFIDSTTGAEF